MRSGAARSAARGNATAGSPPARATADWNSVTKIRCTKSSSSPISSSTGVRLPTGRPVRVSSAPAISSGVQAEGGALLSPRDARMPGRWSAASCAVIEPREWPATPTRPASMRPASMPHRYRAALVAPIAVSAARQVSASSPSRRSVRRTSPRSDTRWRSRARIMAVARSTPRGASVAVVGSNPSGGANPLPHCPNSTR